MSVRLFNSNKERKWKKQAIWEVVKSTLRKKLMKCDLSGRNAYKIIFTNRLYIGKLGIYFFEQPFKKQRHHHKCNWILSKLGCKIWVQFDIIN
ncbi:uncharacterized protein LOC142551112 isoform X2 [Primulina tabacum]|uniref:uncharacterized protein LOC142551112 isoform X2 n=1 Tax=Primulina tabacum TaxID=48773 RepID=UPI003F59DBF2